MAEIIVCDGGCGAQSPNPKTGRHDANGWINVRVTRWVHFGDDTLANKQFCTACEKGVMAALTPEEHRE